MVSVDGCGIGNGGHRSSQGEAAARARVGFTNLSPKLFQTTNRILKSFNCFFFYFNRIGLIVYVVLLTSAAKHEYQASHP